MTVTLSGGLVKTIRGRSFRRNGCADEPRELLRTGFRNLARPTRGLFETPGSGAIWTPLLVPAARATLDDMKQFKGRYGILSTGEWTLTVTVENGQSDELADAAVLEHLASWRLRSTPYGAVLGVPADTTIDYSEVVLGRVPDLTDREVDLTVRQPPCTASADTARKITANDSRLDFVGCWCHHGVFVRLVGPRSYVDAAVRDLVVDVKASRVGVVRPRFLTRAVVTPHIYDANIRMGYSVVCTYPQM